MYDWYKYYKDYTFLFISIIKCKHGRCFKMVVDTVIENGKMCHGDARGDGRTIKIS